MTLLELTKDEKQRLVRLAGDKATIGALKKLFISSCIGKPSTDNTQTLAAERLAINDIRIAFYDLDLLKKETESENEIPENVV